MVLSRVSHHLQKKARAPDVVILVRILFNHPVSVNLRKKEGKGEDTLSFQCFSLCPPWMKITMRLTGLVPGFYFNDSFCRKETLNQVMEGVLRLVFFFLV